MTDQFPCPRRMLAVNGERIQIAAGWQEKLRAVGLCLGGSWPSLTTPTLVAESSNGWCFRLELADGDVVFFKRDKYPLSRSIRYWLRPSRHAVEAFAIRELASLDIPTPELLAVGEKRWFGLLRASCLVTLEVPRSLDLRRYLEEVWIQLDTDARQRIYQSISQQLVSQLRRAHAADFFHADLKWRNILVQNPNEHPTLFWIDAPRARYRRQLRRRGIIADLSALARVAVSVTTPYQRMRFLRDYLGNCSGAAVLYRSVARHLDRRPPKAPEFMATDDGSKTFGS